MKKITYALFAIVCGIFTSCMDSEEIEIRKDVTVTIQPSTVLSSFSAYKEGNLDMYSYEDDLSKLRICAFMYDEEGKLIVEKSALLDDYSSDYTFTLNALDLNKKYQILVVSNAIRGTLENPSLQSYSLSNTSDMNKLTVSQEFEQSFYSNWSILGIGEQKIDPNINTDYYIKLRPGSAMFYHTWKNIHANDSYNVDNYRFIFHNNDQALFDDGNWTYSTTLPDVNNNAVYIDVTNNSGNNYYTIFNLLPCSSMHYFGRFFMGSYSIDFQDVSSKGEGKIDVVAGSTYEVDFDCSTWSIDINKKSSGTKTGVRNEIKPYANKLNCNVKTSTKVLNLL